MENPEFEPENMEYQFLLFISGMSAKSSHAVENMRKICDDHIAGRYSLSIIDINHDKDMAVKHGIIAIPTLIKIVPEPRRTILGDLSETDKVLKILEIKQ